MAGDYLLGVLKQPERDVRWRTGAPGSVGKSGDARDPPYILNYHCRENTNNQNKDNKFYCSQALARDIVIGF